jgi:hypothetical protein
VASFVCTKGTLVDGISNPGEGPYLSVMGVTTELEVHMMALCLFQMIGLVV